MKRAVLKKEALLFFGLIICIFLINSVFAADVAYIYKSKAKVDQNILNVFSEMNLSVELINEKYLPASFSNYRIVFLGDERFKSRNKIKVDDFAFVTTNYYYGYNWGLTDREGVSKLAGTSPLSVRQNGNIVQVYNRALFSYRPIAIPYYYLDDENKAPKMQKAAGTYTGDSYDFGDVISYANQGDTLKNGRYLDANGCFFGIVKSDYWTPEARKMFIDCVNFVSSRCSQDSDCGEDMTSDPYCFNNDVYVDEITFDCIDAGTTNSHCQKNTESVLYDDCEYGCENGICLNECCEDSDCGNESYSENYCSENDLVRDHLIPVCVNGNCASENVTEIVEECSGVCQNGECVEIPCSENSDCGTDGFTGNNFCTGKNVSRNYITYICNNAGQANSYCSSSTETRLMQVCSDSCFNGSCVGITCYDNDDCDDNNVYTYDECNNPGTANSYCTNTLMNCITNNDCGITGFIGSEFCSNDNVFKNFQNSTCINPATTNSYCDVKILQKLINDCGDSYCDNYGNNYCRNGDVYKKRICYNNGCENGGCFSNSYEEEVLVQDCVDACSNGQCTSLVLIHDVALVDFTDSIGGIKIENLNGETIDSLICNQDYKIWIKAKNLGNYTENLTFTGNMGSLNFNHNPKENLVPNDYSLKYKTVNINLSEGWYNLTVIANINQDDNILNNKASRQVQVICHECENNFDCGSESYSSNYCSGNNVVRNHTIPVCINNNCGFEIMTETVEHCSGMCINADCIDIACDENSDCNDNNVYTLDECNNPGTANSYCTNTPVNCVTNNDCGMTGFVGEGFCSSENVFKLYSNSTCINPGTINSYCNIRVTQILINDCGDNYCDNYGQNYCKWNSVYKKRTCYTNGCESGACFSVFNTEEVLVEECYGSSCINGTCVQNIRCNNNSDCNDNDAYTYDECNNPGTSSSYCSNIAMNCINNNDCGMTGFVGNEFCSGNSVFKNFQNSTCANPGTTNSHCVVNVLQKLINDCGIDYCTSYGNNYCDGDDIYRSRSCYDKGCSNNACFSYETIEEQLMQHCSLGCSNGNCLVINCTSHADCNDGNNYTYDACVYPGSVNSYCKHNAIRCLSKADCGTDGFTGYFFCQNNNVFGNFLTFTCNSPGYPFSTCTNSTSAVLFNDCSNNCSNGTCI